MARTLETVEVTVQGGPVDGLRLRAQIKDDGHWHFPAGEVFFPDGLGDYVLDGEGRALIHRASLEP